MIVDPKLGHKQRATQETKFASVIASTIESLGLLDPDPLAAYDDILALLQMATNVPACFFAVFDDDRVFYKSKIGITPTSSELSADFSPADDKELTAEEVQFVEDALNHPEFYLDEGLLGNEPVRFCARLGVRSRTGLPVGYICILDSKPRTCTKEIQRAIVKTCRLIEDNLRTRSTSVTDHLTGLYTKRHFDDMVRREWARAYRHTVPISILMLDIDEFKLFNDHYGHQAGDEALRKVGKALMELAQRAGDVVARYGGEEFVMLLPKTDLVAADIVANRALDAVRNLQIEHINSRHGIVTISIGAAIAASEHSIGCGGAALIRTADQQLYVSKNNGRNQATIALLSGEAEELDFIQPP